MLCFSFSKSDFSVLRYRGDPRLGQFLLLYVFEIVDVFYGLSVRLVIIGNLTYQLPWEEAHTHFGQSPRNSVWD